MTNGDAQGEVESRNMYPVCLLGFLDEAEAIQAEARRVSKCARYTQDLLLATDSRVIGLFTDGSHSRPDGQRGLPALVGWGFLALERPAAVTLHEHYAECAATYCGP